MLFSQTVNIDCENNTELYEIIQNCIELYEIIQNYTELYRIMQNYTELYRTPKYAVWIELRDFTSQRVVNIVTTVIRKVRYPRN